MKTYFQFESLIKSKDVAEGIACPIGAGPFCGFGSVTVDGNTLKVQSQGNDDSFSRMIYSIVLMLGILRKM